MLIKVMIFIVVLAGAGLFFINGPDGEPLMTAEDLAPENPMPESSPAEPASVTVYKWKDENGVWQFSNEPADAARAEILEVETSATAFDPIPATTKASPLSGVSSLPTGLTSVSPEKIGEMMNTVNNLEETMADRKKEIDRATGRN